MNKKQKIILIIVAFLIIVGIVAYLNYQDTSIEAMTTTQYYSGNSAIDTTEVSTYSIEYQNLAKSGTGTICAKANLIGPNGVIKDEPIRVVIIGGNKVVANFTIVSGEEHNITGLTGQHDYLVSYKYDGRYPYKPSSYDDRNINVISGKTPDYSFWWFM